MVDGIRLSELARTVGLAHESDEDPLITGASGLDGAVSGTIIFVTERRWLPRLASSPAAAVILPPGWPSPIPALRAVDPRAAFARVLEHFAPPRERVFPPGRHPTAVVDPAADVHVTAALGPYVVIGPGARVGAGSVLGPHVVVEADAAVGEGCVLHARVIVRERCLLGDRITVHPGAVIGSDGFGFVDELGGKRKIPQIGIVIVGDDVEIGANVCIDRAQTGRTVIGRGTKIDNLVQIGHNVVVGENCALSAQIGISGSCRIGDGVVMGGQAGVADHRLVGSGARVAGKAGVHRDVAPGQAVLGFFARDAREYRRIEGALGRLPDLVRRVRELESAVGGAVPGGTAGQADAGTAGTAGAAGEEDV
ncbi:MAG: UDP-3-O-(3-hydroxymyristoyl)glucosamine N-acyltransferase [Candidatus Krumholzibacteriia bacterium]